MLSRTIKAVNNFLYSLYVFKGTYFTVALMEIGPIFAISVIGIFLADILLLLSLCCLQEQYETSRLQSRTVKSIIELYRQLQIYKQLIQPFKEFSDVVALSVTGFMVIFYNYLTIKAYNIIPMPFFLHYPTTTISIRLLVNEFYHLLPTSV
jgi:hypothetical protein